MEQKCVALAKIGNEVDSARQIFLLTDGEISNVDQVLDRYRSMATISRIFSFSFDQSLDHSLVKGLTHTPDSQS